jgi:ribosomal-protein-alanine N-acetyltransferase
MLQFNFNPFPVLETNRLLLRELVPGDINEIFFLRSDERVLAHIGKEPAKTTDEAAAFIERINKASAANESLLWGITLKENPSIVIGTMCFWNLAPENHRAEIGYVLHPDHWRKGIMSEAMNAALQYGFNEMKLHSVEGRINPANAASAATLESAGFVKEGHLKEEFYFRGQFFDSVIYSLIRP